MGTCLIPLFQTPIALELDEELEELEEDEEAELEELDFFFFFFLSLQRISKKCKIRISDQFRTHLHFWMFTGFLSNLVYWVRFVTAMALQPHLRIVIFIFF